MAGDAAGGEQERERAAVEMERSALKAVEGLYNARFPLPLPLPLPFALRRSAWDIITSTPGLGSGGKSSRRGGGVSERMGAGRFASPSVAGATGAEAGTGSWIRLETEMQTEYDGSQPHEQLDHQRGHLHCRQERCCRQEHLHRWPGGSLQSPTQRGGQVVYQHSRRW
jgi:hypothetical protein